MIKVILYIYQTAREQFRLVGFLKVLCFALVPLVWAKIAPEAQTPSTFTLVVLTLLILSIGILFVIAAKAQSIQEPKFKLDLHVSSPVRGGNHDAYFNFINVSVANISGVNLEHCTAFLKGLSKNQEPSQFDKSIPLIWNFPQDSPEAKIVVGNELLVHVAIVGNKGHGLKLAGKQWNRLKNQFEDHAVYRFEVLVNSGVSSQIITIEVDWKGEWDKFEAKEIAVKNFTAELS